MLHVISEACRGELLAVGLVQSVSQKMGVEYPFAEGLLGFHSQWL